MSIQFRSHSGLYRVKVLQKADIKLAMHAQTCFTFGVAVEKYRDKLSRAKPPFPELLMP